MLNGYWRVIRQEFQGKVLAADGGWYLFQDKNIQTFNKNGEKSKTVSSIEFTLRQNAGKFTGIDGKIVGEKNVFVEFRGILSLEGDSLRFCFVCPEGPRPTEFNSARPNTYLVIMDRDRGFQKTKKKKKCNKIGKCWDTAEGGR